MIKNELPHDGEIDKNTSDEPDHEDGDCRPQHLRPVPSEGHFLGLGLGGHPDGKQGDEEGGKVCEAAFLNGSDRTLGVVGGGRGPPVDCKSLEPCALNA